MKISFKTVLACTCAASAMNGFSQTEQYFRASANGGISTIQYSTDDISSKLFAPASIGGGVTAEYIMFFNQYVGASAGVGASVSRSSYELNKLINTSLPYYYVEEETTKDFVYNANFQNWKENQMLISVDIPVGAVGKYSFSDDITALAGAGVRFQLPVKATYKVADDAARTTTGYFSETNGSISDLPHLGFYTLNGGQKGDLNTKTIGFSAYLDLGVMHKIANQLFYYGIYGQYGFTQINAEPENAFLVQYGAYDSPLNTTAIEKSRLLSFGIKIGYVLPVKMHADESESSEEEASETGTSDAESSEVDGSYPKLKPELDDHPYTTVRSESETLSSESSNGNVVKEESSSIDETPAKEGNAFKRFFGKFKKKSSKSETAE